MEEKRIAQQCLGIGPEEGVPHFVIGARLVRMPAELAALPANARITRERNLAGRFGSGTGKVAELREELAAIIQRQRDGYFTLEEAAQVLADARPEVGSKEALRRFLLAHASGALPIHQCGTRFLMEPGERVSDWQDLLMAAELDVWLRKTAGYGFPPADAAEPVPPANRNKSGRATRWTDSALDELREYRKAHGSKKAAEWADISEQRLRALLPGERPKAKGYSAFTHRSA